MSRVACETLVTTDLAVVAGEITTGAPLNRAAVDEIVRRVSAAVAEIWSDILSDASNQHGTFPEAPDLAELREVFTVLAPGTTVFATSFRIRVPARPLGRVLVLVPQPYLMPYVDSLEAAAENTFVRNAGESSDERLRYLGDVPVPIVALLGRAEMTVSELHALEEEDVILLDQEVSHPLQVLVGGGARLLATPGTGPDGSRRAIQITHLGVD
jgi:flagellar motor switch protein FliM